MTKHTLKILRFSLRKTFKVCLATLTFGNIIHERVKFEDSINWKNSGSDYDKFKNYKNIYLVGMVAKQGPFPSHNNFTNF